MASYQFYLLSCAHGRFTYTGISTNCDKRLRQHRREIKGGARYTIGRARYGLWTTVVRVNGFPSDRSCRRFEWFTKCNHRRGAIKEKYRDWLQQHQAKLELWGAGGGKVKTRVLQILHLCSLPEWNTVKVNFHDDQFAHLQQLLT